MDYESVPSFEYSEEYEENNGFCDQETVVKVGSITVPLFLVIVFLLSIFGNILILVVLTLYGSLRSLTNKLIFNLALSDLMFTAGLPFWSFYYMWGGTFSNATCKGINFVFSAGFYSSVVFLMLMTIQRYLAAVHPLLDWERGQCFAAKLILGSWAMSIAAALPALLYSEVLPDPEHTSTFYCEFNSQKAKLGVTVEQNIFFMVAFVVIGFCYIRILQTVLAAQTRKRHRTARLIFCIVTVFFLGWAPYNIVIFLQTFTYLGIKPFTECYITDYLEYTYYACKLLAFSHCCLNPVFYVFVGEKFREHLKAIVEKRWCRQNITDPTQPRIVTVHGLHGSL